MRPFKLIIFLLVALIPIIVGAENACRGKRVRKGKETETVVKDTALSFSQADTALRKNVTPLVPVSVTDVQPTDSTVTADTSSVAKDSSAVWTSLPALPDSLRSAADSSIAAAAAIIPDSTSVADSTALSDTLLVKPEGAMDYPAFSSARDSIIEDFSGGKTMIYYYGDATVTYDNLKITSEYMQYDADNSIVFASGVVTDTAGTVTGKPVMTEGNKTYDMDEVYYNFKSRKAKVKNMITQETDAIMHGEKIKMMPDKSINVSGGKYTVCDAPHPHYYLKMTTAKVETTPKQRTVFGPAYVVVADVPMPLILPFGFVPARPDRASGILFPTFGEEEARGFYIQDGGLYFAFGDYLDIALTGSYYTLGSWSAKINSRYKVRYKCDGNFNFNYSNDKTGDKGSADYFETTNFGLQWSHAQDSKAHPGMAFRASVNFSSPSNSKYNSRNVTTALQNQISSSISFSRTWQKASVSVNALHSQNSRDSSYAITLPNITFTLNRLYPFKKKERVGKEKWYEQFSLSYTTALQNKVNFKVSDFSQPGYNLLDQLQTGMSHKFTIGLPSFTLLKYINFSPSVSYGQNWFFQSNSRYYDPETDKLETIKTRQFEDFGITQDFSASISMSTRIYGTFNAKNQNGYLKAVRHVITPSLSATYKPEHGTTQNGYLVYSYIDNNGKYQSVEYNKWAGGLNSVPGKGEAASLSFSLGNNLEAKVRDKKDTTGAGTKKVKLIDQLNFAGSYNFIADSMKLSNISVSLSTNVMQKVGLHGSLTLDPYAVNSQGQRYDKYNVYDNGHLFRLTNASASFSFSLSGEGKTIGDAGGGSGAPSGGMESESASGKDANTSKKGGPKGGGVKLGSDASPYMHVYYDPITGEYIPDGWVYYMNTNSPWALNFSYNLSYNKSYSYANSELSVKHNITQTLGVTAQFRFTKDFSINVNTGLDLTKFKISTTQISATYDLHCFAISVSYVPTGQWKQWSFRIAAKAAALSDLLQYKKSSSYWDN